MQIIKDKIDYISRLDYSMINITESFISNMNNHLIKAHKNSSTLTNTTLK